MNAGIGILIVASLVMGTGCSQQKEVSAPAASSDTQAQGLAQEVQVVTDQVKASADQAAQAAAQAKMDAEQAANGLSARIQDLLAQAKAYVDSGKFDEAIAQAQEVLKLDPNNVDAKSIIETAKEKMIAMAGDVKQGLTDKFNAMSK